MLPRRSRSGSGDGSREKNCRKGGARELSMLLAVNDTSIEMLYFSIEMVAYAKQNLTNYKLQIDATLDRY